MNFGDAVKEHDKGNDVYRESDTDWFWSGNDVLLCWTNNSRNMTRYFKDSDINATDWAVVEDKKVFCLSDKLKKMVDITDESGQIVLSCEIDDLQQFITEIKDIIHEEFSRYNIINGVFVRIDKTAGDRFK